MSAQRWYAVEFHGHGKGRWTRHVRPFPSREHANAWARGRGWLLREEATNGARQTVYRIVPVPMGTTRAIP